MNIRIIIYFFINFFLLISGFVFVLPLFFDTKEKYDTINEFIFGNHIHVLLGFVGIIFAIANIFLPVDLILIIGDLLPILILLIISFLLLLGFVRNSKYLPSKLVNKGNNILTNLQIPIGFVGIGVGFIHIFLANIIIF